MRKIWVLFVGLGLLMADCSYGNTERDVNKSQEVVKKNEESTGSNMDENVPDKSIEETANEATNEIDETMIEEETEEAEVAATIEDYDELQSIDEEQFNPSDYEVRVLADNANKRVLMFIDDHDKRRFKTIYVKHDHFLKVIDIQQNQLVMKKNIS